jgi:hypothetical protein
LISVLLAAPSDPKPLVRLLTALVPAAAEGLVREVAVIGATGPVRAIADDAGAELYDDFAAAFVRAKGPWIAALPMGAGLVPDWMEPVTAHLAHEPAAPARLIAGSSGLSWRSGPAGWLAPKALTPSAVVVEQDLQRLTRRGRPLRILQRR